MSALRKAVLRCALLCFQLSNSARIRSGELTVETPGLLAALTVMARNQIAIDQPGYKAEGSL